MKPDTWQRRNSSPGRTNQKYKDLNARLLSEMRAEAPVAAWS
jgi:hypothetical protein